MRVRWWWLGNSREVVLIAIIDVVVFVIFYFVLHVVNWWVSLLLALVMIIPIMGVIVYIGGIVIGISRLRKYLANKRRKRDDQEHSRLSSG